MDELGTEAVAELVEQLDDSGERLCSLVVTFCDTRESWLFDCSYDAIDKLRKICVNTGWECSRLYIGLCRDGV